MRFRKRITNTFWLYPSYTELEVCNEQEMKRKWQYSHVQAMLQSQRDGWRFRVWTWKKVTDLILFSADGVVSSVYFFPSASTHILSIRISAFIGVSRGVVVWDWSLEDLYSQAWFHHASTRWAEWRKSVLDFQPTRSVCPDYANDMPISFSSLTTAQQTGHLIWNPHSL